LLAVAVADNKAGIVVFLDGPGRRESGGPSFQDTTKRASKTTARIRSSKKAAKIIVSRTVPQSDPVTYHLDPSLAKITGVALFGDLCPVHYDGH
jgi:hypothetical protein